MGKGSVPPEIMYKGTVTGLRVSSVDGAAFVDNVDIAVLPQNGKIVATNAILANAALMDTTTANAFYGGAVDLTAYQTGNYAVRFRNTVGGGVAEAYISAVAPGGLSTTELSGDISFVDASKWTIGACWTVNNAGDGNAVAIAGAVSNLSVKPAPSSQLGRLIQYIPTIQTISAVSVYWSLGQAEDGLADATQPFYWTVKTTAGAFGLYKSLTGEGIINALSMLRIEVPVATGALLLSTKGGSRGFYRKDASFNPNAAMTMEVLDVSLSAFTDGNHLLEVYDASGRMVKGFMKSQGTGETLDDEIIPLLDFTSVWTGTFTAIDANSFSTAGGAQGPQKTASFSVVGALYKVAWDGTTTATDNIVRNDTNGSTIISGFGIGYTTSISGTASLYLRHGSAGQTDVTSLSDKRVLTPSASGLTIVSIKNGNTYNFSYKNASFTYNAASYQIVIKKIREYYQAETKAYIAIAGVSLTDAELLALDENIKLVKYSTGLTIANVACNLSTVAGTAFITNPTFTATGLPSNDLRWAVGFKLSWAAGGKTAVGFGKDWGRTGETYTEELLTPTILMEAGWTDNGDGTYTGVTAGFSFIYKNVSVANALYKMAHTINSVTAGGTQWGLGSNTGGYKSTPGNFVDYATCSNHTNITVGFQSVAFSGVVSGLSAKRVLTPSDRGLTIVSALGGSTYNWTSNDGLPPNSASFALTITRD